MTGHVSFNKTDCYISIFLPLSTILHTSYIPFIFDNERE